MKSYGSSGDLSEISFGIKKASTVPPINVIIRHSFIH
jgi:hypothetical protein